MKKISIIVPVYNVGLYLERCLCACVHQTLSDIEVIIVNDASTDESVEIINKYQNERPDLVKVISNRENGGPGKARNQGIHAASGEYLCFIDADDYVDYDMCELMYSQCKKDSLDILYCERDIIDGEKRRFYGIYNSWDFRQKEVLSNFHSACHMIIKREFVVDKQMYFPEGILHEDTSITPIWYLCAGKVGYLEKPYYHQVMRSSSITHNIGFSSAIDMIKACEILVINAERLGVYQQYKSALDCYVLKRMFGARRILQNKYIDCCEDEKKSLEETLLFWRNYNFCFDIIKLTNYQLNTDDIVRFIEKPFDDLIGTDCYQKQRIAGFCEILKQKKHEIVIYGYGKNARYMIETLQRLKVKFYIVASDVKGECEKKQEFAVYSLDWIKKNLDNPFFILGSNLYAQEMIENLKNKGYKKHYIRMVLLTGYLVPIDQLY